VIPVVVYGVKSSPDEKESVADQHRIVLEAIGREGGRELIAEPFGEANQSGYRKERGPQLEAALRAAVEAAKHQGEAELWVWHSSRLARGDGTKGKRSIQKVVADLLYEGVKVRSATDAEMVNPMLVGIASKVSNEYSANLSTWTRAGMERRRRRGAPLGALPFGYMVEKKIVDGRLVSTRVVDPDSAPVVEEIYRRIADGMSNGNVARWLNARGMRTRRGAPFVARNIRQMIENTAYDGQKAYPAIVDADLAQAARAALARLDPAAMQRRKGGRPTTEPYLLRGIAFCAGCGKPMYASGKYVRKGRRSYVCAHKVLGTGLCDRPPIRAELLEGHVLKHLKSFVGSVESWIGERLAERDCEAQGRRRQLDAEKAQLAALDRQREERMAELAEHGITSPLAFEVVERIDREREGQAHRIAEAEAILGEFSGSPDVDSMLDFYNELVDTIQGRVSQARSARELNETLSSILGGLWCELDPDSDYGRLLVQFELRVPAVQSFMGVPLAPELQSSRLWLPPARLDWDPLMEPPEWSQTGHFTTVSACCPYRLLAWARSWKIDTSWMLWLGAVEAISARCGNGATLPASSRHNSNGCSSRPPASVARS
jgi:DNA invertase Pin-like site-specific DNA recombinase